MPNAQDPPVRARVRARSRAHAPRVAAVRGAIQVRVNEAPAIREATARLLERLLATNRLAPEYVVSAIFTATPDLTADFPAHAARRLGWADVPLLGATEVDVPGALPRVVRVLLTVELPATSGHAKRLAPVYLDGAEALRPDLHAGASATATGAAPGARARVAILGLGQIGGSLGLALGASPARGGWERVGFDRVRATAQAALRAGAVDRIEDSLAAACAGAALAVVAVPVDRIADVIDRAAAALPRGAALVDTGSSRRAATRALVRAAARGVRAVGGHPIAGNEGRGFKSARAELFRGATFALLPLPGRGVPAPVRRLVRDLGARARVTAPGAHDRALARTSHLPYLMSRALAVAGNASARRGLAGPGFRGMTRLARMDPRVAEAYCRDNARAIESAWRELAGAIERDVRRLGPGGDRRRRDTPGSRPRS